jgi:nucleotide-binding universal stress UspA family protein
MKPSRRGGRILYATDFSPASRQAFDTAVTMAKALQADLIIVNVIVPIVTVPDQYISPTTIERLDVQARKWSVQHLERLAIRGRKAGVRVSLTLRDGYPADEIIRAARDAKSNFIVMGTHGRSGLRRLLLGSVAARVVATASCPVVTVRSK